MFYIASMYFVMRTHVREYIAYYRIEKSNRFFFMLYIGHLVELHASKKEEDRQMRYCSKESIEVRT